MRTLKLLSSVVLGCSLAASASAQKVGDKIVVTTDKAPLRSQDATTGSVPKGAILVVKHVNGDWFWVVYSSAATGTVKGWINRPDVIPFSEALDFFTEEVKRSPTASAYYIRAMIWHNKGENDIALGDYNESVGLDPKLAPAYAGRSHVWLDKREYEKAIADSTEAIRLDPKQSGYYYSRGVVLSATGEYGMAIADFNEAIRLDPKSSYPWNGRAWLAATCPDAKYRNGKKAIEDATTASELTAWNDVHTLDALAAAYAEAGDFPNAVKWEQKAIELVPENMKAELRSHLDLYKAHKPYRTEAKK